MATTSPAQPSPTRLRPPRTRSPDGGRRGARAGLHGHLEAGLDEPVRDLGHEGHAGLAGGGFLGYGDDHSFPDGGVGARHSSQRCPRTRCTRRLGCGPRQAARSFYTGALARRCSRCTRCPASWWGTRWTRWAIAAEPGEPSAAAARQRESCSRAAPTRASRRPRRRPPTPRPATASISFQRGAALRARALSASSPLSPRR